MEIEKGIGNGTENEGGRLGALPSTTACYLLKTAWKKDIKLKQKPLIFQQRIQRSTT